ncbi:unnamed protein product [Adineta steineri]|uniref:Uncharacterized protein n=1 Tax=Adineta steineri TaxID=433720 RepID=A0A815CR33_9BILA|nr:unnamed protein product [Adineta steineri]CAF1310570.1 unnamed protein product [Adineta steineri]CAF3488279.1 unnamed protein product [Adineta steineri]CAF3817971.1 unnamed protein product [Adineta steineri]
MQRLATGIAVLFLVILSFYSTDAYNCYVCTSVSDGCGASFDATKLNSTGNIVAATGNQTCTKGQIGDLISRGVADVSTCTNGANGCNTTSLLGATFASCCCNTNLCNGVSSIQHQYSLFISAISMFIVIKNVFTI